MTSFVRVARFIMGFILIASQSVQARAPRCEAVFSADSQIRLAVQDVIAEHFESDVGSLINRVVLRYSARQLMLHKAPSSGELRERVARVDRLIQLASRMTRGLSVPNTEESRWVQREILSGKLESLMQQYGYDQNQSRSVLKKIFSHRAVRFLLNPGELPFVADRSVPAPILERALRDGPESIRAEINAYYRSQNQNYVDGYRHFATAYKVVALTLFAVLSWQGYEDAMESINEKKKEQLNESLDNMSDFLNDMDQEFEKRGLYKN